MLAEIIAALIIGILFGTLTGLIPGIHINLIGSFLISLSTGLFLEVNPIYLVVFISSMAITHTFVDFIPSILLGCPDTSTELSVLPGHELLKKGQGFQAILLSVYGSLAAIMLLLIISYPSLKFIPKLYSEIEPIMPYLLIGVSTLMILLERKRLTALKVFLVSGLLGWSVLNLNNLNQPLLPLLTGLFGSSMLIMSIKNKPEIPEQNTDKKSLASTINKKSFFKSITASLISSPLCSFLPGLGAGQAAIIGNTISLQNKRDKKKGFLVLLGATNTLVMGFSFVTLYLLYKTRTGAAAAIQTILGNLNHNILILIIVIVFLSGIISFFLTKNLAKFSCKKINLLPYEKFSIITLIILTIIVILVSGLTGLVVFIISTITGFYLISLGIRRTNMMGCLLIPTILIYLGI